MSIKRRIFLLGAVAAATIGPAVAMNKGNSMYGLIGKLTAQSGKRDTLTAILIAGIASMPGCISYVVANDPTDVDVIWITEVWESKEAHAASLSLPSVRDAITKVSIGVQTGPLIGAQKGPPCQDGGTLM